MKRVVISDVHIGSKYYKSDRLIKFLKEVEYDELILAGDIIDFQKIPKFSLAALDVYNAIDFSKRIIYIPGNHDASLKGFVGHEAFGFEFMKFYEFEENGRKFRIEHGDRFDGLAQNYELFMSILSVVQKTLENILDVNLAKWWTELTMKRRKLRRIWDILKWNEDVDVLIIGHLHYPEFVVWGKGGKIITYINSGDWLDHESYVYIKDGIVRLKSFERSIEDGDNEQDS